MTTGGRAREYLVRSTFRAPLPFVYRWCTEYDPEDGRYSGEGYQRRILNRSARQVVFEDLYDTKHGWIWIHRTVQLLPPTRWHAESVGSDRILTVDYLLSELPGECTQLTIHARRRPYATGTANPSKIEWERDVTRNWERFGRVLEKEYRGGRVGRTAQRRRRALPRRD